jgi:hypothetical protein
MTDTWKISLYTVLIGMSMSLSAQLLAEEFARVASLDEPRDASLYYQPPTTYRPDTRAIIHQKAQARAQERQARMASLSWYGMSNARPTAAPTPFTSLYSPVWQMPGGRPFAWHTRTWPTYVVYGH